MDDGSTNGTFLNGNRLTPPRTKSQPKKHAVKIGDIIELGTTVRIVVEPPDHVIIENEQEQYETSANSSKNIQTPVHSLAVKDNKALKKQFMMTQYERDTHIHIQSKYTDRADKRRQDNPYHEEDDGLPKPVIAPTVSEVYQQNKGFQLLKQMGWKQGLGLGKITGGILNPIEPAVQRNRMGLGFGRE